MHLRVSCICTAGATARPNQGSLIYGWEELGGLELKPSLPIFSVLSRLTEL